MSNKLYLQIKSKVFTMSLDLKGLKYLTAFTTWESQGQFKDNFEKLKK